jgi:phosphopantothenoylcysteine decarboxylase/phosphopantothenate--cysteine ligase
MTNLAERHILLGITGGIAAYKSADLVRRLREAGAHVRVVMTPAAKAFITPLTLQALSGYPVHEDLFDKAAEAAMGHIELARWADIILIAPASADFLAQLAHGLADNLLNTLCLATTAPMAVAPAMNQQMWLAPAVQHNCQILQSCGVSFWGPAIGSQACGEVGPGRMLEPAQLVTCLETFFLRGPLQGLKVVITAGPTQEPIDPVRYLSNHSSGKMGYALAKKASELGAEVILISGPVHLTPPPRVKVIPVVTAAEMYAATQALLSQMDIFIGAAAVADYQVTTVAPQKIKKTQAQLSLQLTRNPDILSAVALQPAGPFVVGFAAETEHLAEATFKKFIDKKLDMIVGNLVGASDGGFVSDNNSCLVFWDGGKRSFSLKPKDQLASELIDLIAEKYHEKNTVKNS